MMINSLLKTSLLTGCVLLSSCAYMQTHKNVEEFFTEQTAYHINHGLQLYRAGEDYYLAVEKQEVRVRYPIVYDSIFLKNDNDPSLDKVNQQTEMVYARISAGTAQVLQRKDGYAELSVLSIELQDTGQPFITSLPAGARLCKTQAEISGVPITWQNKDEIARPPLAARALGAIDRVVIDWPGTILYNASIPLLAPFVFFYDFFTEQ